MATTVIATTTVYLNSSRDAWDGTQALPTAVLHRAAQFELDHSLLARRTGKPDLALEHLFEQLNVGGDMVPATDWTLAYRRAGNRSLTVGDVVVLDGTPWMLDRMGWEPLAMDTFLARIDYRTWPEAMGRVARWNPAR